MRFLSALLCSTALLSALLFAQRGRPSVFAIRDARILVTPQNTLARGTVVIRDGLIEEVGADVVPPADAIEIDGKELTVHAGFIDALNNWGFDASQRKSAVGDPAVEDLAAEALASTKPDNRKGLTPEFLVRTALKLDAEVADAWRKVGITAGLMAPDGGLLLGQSALVSLSDAPARETVLASPVAQHLSFRPIGGNDYPRVLMGLVAHVRQTLLDAGHHARLVDAFARSGGAGRRPPADPSLEALRPVLEGKMPIVIEADSRDQIDRALDFAAEFQLKPILYGGREAYKALDRIKVSGVPLLLRVDFSSDSDPVVQIAERYMPPRIKAERKQQRAEELSVPALLAQRGIPFALSAQGLSGDRPTQKFQEQLRRAITAGVRPDELLTALTTAPAKLFGVEKQLGTVEKGKAAHLVVTQGDWYSEQARICHVFVDGKHFDYTTPTSGPTTERERPEGGPRFGKGRKKDPEPEKTPPKEKAKAPEAPAVDPRPTPQVTDAQASETEADRKPSLRTGGDVLLRNATVLPVSGPTLQKTDLLVRKGKITAIGPALEAPAGVQVIDLTGMFVMPGIIDTHCHFAISGGVNEFSLSVVPEVRIRDVINSEDVQIYRALAGGVTTARLLHGSANVIGGQDAVIKLKYGRPARDLLVSTGPPGVKFALGENVKRTDGRFPNTRLGVEAVLVRAFTEAAEYQRNWQAYQKTKTGPEPRRDLRLEALADVLNNRLKIHCHCYRADEILMLLRVCDRFGVRVASLQHVLEGYKVAPEIARHGPSCSPFSDWWAYKWEAADAIPYCAALLHEAGVSVALKSDSNELMRHMFQEAAKTIKYGGLSEIEALKTITLNGAVQLGIDQRTGSIEVGKDADFAVFNGHPLNSYSRVEMTFVEGELYFQRKESKPFAAAAAGPTAPAVRSVRLPEAGERLLFYNATVHPVSGPVLEKGTVEIVRGKIVEVRPTTREDRDPGRDRFDASGLHIYPGMIDAGTVLGLVEVDSARETIDHAESGDFQPDLRASTAIHPDSELIPVTRANGVLSVVSRPTGGVIAGQSALINLAGWVPEEMAVVDPLALHVELPGGLPGIGRGSPFGMASRTAVRRTRDLKLRRLRELFRQALVYDRARKEVQGTPANPRLEALTGYANGSRPVIVQASRREEIDEALALADELKIKIILAGGVEAWKVADQLKKRDIPVIVGPILTLPYENYDPYDAPYACPALLHAAGVRFCIRSNGDNNTRNLPYHAAMAVSHGLSPEEGLKAVTLYPAQILGVADRLGSIDKGKTANLVLTNGDLLQASTQVLGLVIDGKPLAPTSKHTRLYERYQERLREVQKGKGTVGGAR